VAGRAGEGHSDTEGTYDEGRQHDDQLPASRGTSKLLPLHHLQPSPDGGGH